MYIKKETNMNVGEGGKENMCKDSAEGEGTGRVTGGKKKRSTL